MRDIKFRAYIKKDYNKELVGKILNVSSIHLKTRKAIIGYSISKSNYGNHSFDFENIELMQYTGLHDKNGKEIYEGDIVAIEFQRATKRGKAVVVYDSKYASFVIKESGEIAHENKNIGDYQMENFEVIGNIYENKELLGN